jgi:hypothetical protein
MCGVLGFALVTMRLEGCPVCAAPDAFTAPGMTEATANSSYQVTCLDNCGEYTITLDAIAEVRAWVSLNPARAERLAAYLRSQHRNIDVDKGFLRHQR